MSALFEIRESTGALCAEAPTLEGARLAKRVLEREMAIQGYRLSIYYPQATSDDQGEAPCSTS